jgi:hypothetical protein
MDRYEDLGIFENYELIDEEDKGMFDDLPDGYTELFDEEEDGLE